MGETDRYLRIKTVFARAAELSLDERDAFLSEACADDPALRAEVEGLLAEEDDMPTSFLESPPGIEAVGASIFPGRTLGHYEIVRQIGSGGMGDVWEARDRKLKRRVALKILPAAFAIDRSRLERFQREAEAVAALNHPNIVTVYSVEEVEGIHFLTMELVDGRTLKELIPQGGLEKEEFFGIALGLTAAVATAHEKGVLHRDLKPGNVMVTADGLVKVLDFGLAKILETTEPGETGPAALNLTAPGLVMGTPSYMSPEQAEGKPVDPRSDVFSLGVLLYEMATGQRPFVGESVAAVVGAILKDQPRAISAIRTDLPIGLTALMDRCLEKSRDDRSLAVSDLHDQLVALCQEALSGHSSRWPAWVALAVAVVASVCGYYWFALRSEPGPPPTAGPVAEVSQNAPIVVAVLPFENLGPAEDDYFAVGVTEEITARLASLSEIVVIASNSARQYADSTKTATEIGEELGADYLVIGSVRWATGPDGVHRIRITPKLVSAEKDVQVWAQTYDRDFADIFGIQSEVAVRVVESLDRQLLDSERSRLDVRPTDNMEAYQLYLRSLAVEGVWYDEPVIRRRVGYLTAALDEDPEFAEAWAELATQQCYLFGYRHDRSDEQRERAWNTVQRAIQVSSVKPELEHQVLMQYYMHVDRDYARALEEATEFEELSPNNPTALSFQGFILRREGHWQEAATKLEHARRIDPRAPNVMVQLGTIYAALGRYDEALSTLSSAIEIDPSSAAPYFGMAMVYWVSSGDVVAARRVLDLRPEGIRLSPLNLEMLFWQLVYEGRPEQALRFLADVDGDALGMTLHFRPVSLLAGFAWRLSGDEDAARREFESAARALETELESRPDSEKVLSSLGLAYAALGQVEDAVSRAERACELLPLSREPYFGQSEVEDLAWVLTLVGDYDRALDQLEILLSVPSNITIAFLEMDPRWQPLVALPRFHELERKYD